MRERLMQLLSRYFNIGDSYTYNLTRDKAGFAVGTVDLDDFEEYTDDDMTQLADYLLEAGVILPPVKLGEAVWYFTSKYSTVIQAAEVLGIYYNGTWWSFMLKLNNDVICEATWGIDEVYTTREAAEAALKAREKW